MIRKQIQALFLSLTLSISMLTPILAQEEENTDPLELSSHSALLMEQSTGVILYEKNSSEPMAPASVTKIMTILLVMEALEQQQVGKEDMVTISEQAAGMGGSQVFLKEGETMSLWELLKCVVVVSGNDASVALAEHLAGSESSFVQKMNQRAQELGMVNTLFFNCTGLPQAGHTTTAHDIALMSRELMGNHPEIQELTTIWMDSIRDDTFDLSNTNRLIHDYSAATGLKTGYTDTALYCMSATASRDNMDLIAVVLKAPSTTERFNDAKSMLEYGFNNYTLQEVYLSTPLPALPVLLGEKDYLQLSCTQPVNLLLDRSLIDKVTTSVNIPDILEAPISQDQVIGTFDVFVDGKLMKTIPITVTESVKKLSLWGIFQELLTHTFLANS